MKEGKWYKVIDASNPPTKFDDVCRLLVGEFWLLSKDDGSALPKFTSVDGEWWYLKKTRFDPTPYIRKADGRFAPEKGESMIEGKWYKCVESGSGVEAGKYYKCSEANTGGGGDYPVYSCWVSTSGSDSTSWNRRFDPTPHERTVFPNAPDLIERVRRIDPAAAEWLEFGDHSKAVFDAGRRNLDDMMVWSSAPQGHSYWERIHDAVDYEEEEEVPEDDFKKGERVEVRDDEDEDWEPAVFLCMDEESHFKHVARRDRDSIADGHTHCRRPIPKRPHIEPGTPIEVWDDEGETPELRRFGCWTGARTWVVRDSDDTGWRHCRVLVPNGVEV